MFNERVLSVQPALAALRDRLLDADPEYVLNTRHSNAWAVTGLVARLPHPVTHEDLDRMGAPRSVSLVRSLLVELEVLEPRDEYAITAARVTRAAIDELPHRADRLALERFVRWRARHRNEDLLTLSQAANDRHEVRKLVSMITAFNAAGTTVATAHQETLDRWSERTKSAFKTRRFLNWCAKTGITDSLVPPAYHRTQFGLGGTQTAGNEAALRAAVSDHAMPARIRIAVLLVVGYGVRVHRVAAMRRDAFKLHAGRPSVLLGQLALDLPPAAASWVREVVDRVPIRRRVGGSAHDDTWLFPGYRHGGHMLPSSLASILRGVGVSAASAHQVSSAAIISQVPPIVVARLLGVSVTTAAQWHGLTAAAAEHR